jgi:NAD(P)H-hydrate epimerase
MIPLLTAEQMRALDAHAIDGIGIPGIVLMENASRAVLDAIEDRFDDVEFITVAVVCGPGNNGGDGFAVARQLFLRGADVDVFLLCEEKALKGDALTNYLLLEPLGVATIQWARESEGISLEDYDLVIDAVFGTGTVREPDGTYRQAIETINDSPATVLAIDVPSGVNASTGEVPGVAVQADVTVSLQCAKCGLLLPPGRDLVGDLVVSPISIPEVEEITQAAPFALTEDVDILHTLPARPRDAHKGVFGNLLVIAGSRGMSGAARLVAMAALRSGVGLVKVACPDSIRAEVAAIRPEIMTIGLPETAAGTISAAALEMLKPHLEWADALAVGPGLGTDDSTAHFLRDLLKIVRRPMVIDADALNIIAAHNLQADLPPDAVITPHPGEFDRLTKSAPSSLQNRLRAARDLARNRKLCVVLKGAPSVCFDSEGLGMINPTGNPGLATAGSGDVLTGIIASLRAQGLDGYTAAWTGCYLHGRAADLALPETGTASLMAGDVITYLAAAFASLEESSADDGHEDHESGCGCGGHHA